MIFKTKTGWEPIGVEDLRAQKAEPGFCERCGRSDLRFLHTLEHPCQGQMLVGRECAKRLCWGYDANREEARLRKLFSRRNRWLTRNWGTSWNGNETITFTGDGQKFRVTIFTRGEDFSFCLSTDGEPMFSPGYFETAERAKLAAFDKLAEILEW